MATSIWINIAKQLLQSFTGNPWDQDLQWDALRGKNAKGERIMVHMR